MMSEEGEDRDMAILAGGRATERSRKNAFT
jgi:hypothetical protein